ncbi:MAG: GNAT family N-acetyltransferase [Clostridia bacterium]|nr:GNAT family N-acetyltransferase [Clostridia bacterium]
MKVINYFESENKAHWLDELNRCDWRAGRFLHGLLRENTFFETVGDGSRVLLLTNGDELISFCTFSKYDDIQPTDLTPWIGFVYTFAEHRGHRCAGLLFDEATGIAKAENVAAIYLSTNHIGLYEKYGFEYYDTMTDVDGEPSRVYIKRIGS